MTGPENAGGKQGGRFQKGRSGNPTGKPKGARHRATLAAEALTRKAVELALAGDVIALRLCLERILSPRREGLVTFTLPALRSAADTAAAMAAILAAVGDGHIGLAEASEAAKLVDAFVRASEVTETAAREERVEALFGFPR